MLLRSRIFSLSLFLILSVLCIPPLTFAAPAKVPPLAPGANKSMQPDLAVDPAKTGELTPGALQPIVPGTVGAARSNDPKNNVPQEISGGAGAGFDKKSEKIIASVNGKNITQADYERFLLQRRINPDSKILTAEVIDQILDEIFDEILIKDYVEKIGRLHDKMLEQRIEGLKLQAISEYFQYIIASGFPPLSEDDIKTFVSEHPDYFRDRRYYYYTSLDIIKNPDVNVNQLRSMLSSSDNFNKIIQTLDSKKISYSVFRGFRPSEQINETVFTKLKTMAPGESALVAEPESNLIFIVKLFSSSADPIDAEKKREEIRMALIMDKVSTKSRDLIKQLHDSADIKFIDKPKALASAAPGKFAAANARVKTPSEGMFKKFDWRGKKRTDDGDFAKDISSGENQNKNDLNRQFFSSFISNIWILSLLLIVPAAFYNFVNISNATYADVVLNSSQGINREFRSSYNFQKLLLDPIVTWIIGITLSLLIGYIALDAFEEKNLALLFLGKKSIIISVTSAFLLSAFIIYAASRAYQRLPDYVKNFRLMFFVIIIILNIVILKIL